MPTQELSTALDFLFHPHICAPPSTVRQPSQYIQTIYRDFRKHIRMDLSKQNNNLPVGEMLEAPKIVSADGWSLIDSEIFFTCLKEDLFCYPIPIFYQKNKSPNDFIQNSIQFRVLFNTSHQCKAFIGYVHPDLPADQVITLLAVHFRLYALETAKFKFSAMDELEPISQLSGLTVGGIYTGIIIVEDVLDSKKSQNSDLSAPSSLSAEAPSRQKTVIHWSSAEANVGQNLSTGVEFRSYEIPHFEQQCRTRLWSEKKQHQIMKLKQQSRALAWGPTIPLPSETLEEMERNLLIFVNFQQTYMS